MKPEKGKTASFLREKRGVSEQAKVNLKEFSRIKKLILNSLSAADMTIDQLSEKIDMPKPDVVYYLMSLIKFGYVKIGEIDDMDEYYTYKLNK